MLLAAGALAWMGGTTAADAQGKLEAHYTVTLAGIPIGKGDWIIDISDTHYKAAASGATTGLVRIFTGGEGTSVADGKLLAGKPISAMYVSTIISRKRTDKVRIKVNNGDVKEFKVDPPQDKESERVPLTAAHRHGVLDPMTASLFRAPADGKPLSKQACQRTVAIFDGRMRYDLQLAYKRMDAVKADKGYSGQVVVCAIYFLPVAGYIPSRSTIKYIAKQRDMEIWLAPIAGTHVLVPIRAQSPTPLGEAVLKATQFVTSASSTRASANGTKTQ
jgi:Protein of unknown function (DUF3108)